MNKTIYYFANHENAFSNRNIAEWYCKKVDNFYKNISLDSEKFIEQYYLEGVQLQKESLLDLLKEKPEETKKMIDEVLDEMYKRK